MTHRNPAVQARVDALNAERYGPSLWWAKPTKSPGEETAALLRRMLIRATEVQPEEERESA